MKCPDCGGRTRVVNTRPQPGGIRRQHACDCGFGGYTAEVWLRGPMPKPQPKGVYTKEEAALVKKKQVTVRRTNEDRRKKDAS